MEKLKLIATAAFGLEAVVARELQALGYTEQTVSDGRVDFTGDAMAICRTNLWLRSADRVLLSVGQFNAMDFGQLFDQTSALPWSDLLPVDAAFPVSGKSVKSQLHSVPHCQSIVKKAIVENLKHRYGRARFEETGARFPIEVAILRNRVTLTVDTSGAGLHKRGYRTLTGAAPLRETLAAGLIQLSYWNRDRAFIDPFCGSGTIPIEAVLIGRNIAPGIARDFAAERWSFPTTADWRDARTEAKDARLPRLDSPVIGTDRDEAVLRLARTHARQAGIETDIHFQQGLFAELSSKRDYGCIICNPPYGERLGELRECEQLYGSMKSVIDGLSTWSMYLLTSHSRFEHLYGTKANRRRKLYNGRIECTYYQFHGPRPPRSATPLGN